MNHSLRWGLMLILVLVLSLSACTREQDDVLAENPEGQATEEGSGTLFGAPEGEGDAAAEAAAVEAPAAEGEAPAAEGEAPAAEGEAPAAEGEAPAAEGEAPAAEGEAPAAEGEAPAADAAAEAGTVEAPAEGEAAPEPQATTIAIDAVTAEEGGDDTTAQASGNVYSVAEGDTLLSIAEKNATTVDELRALNNLSSNFIYVGQELQVPSQVVQTSDNSGDAVVETTAETSSDATAEGSDDATAEGSSDATAAGSETTAEAPVKSASTTTTDGSGNIIHVVQADEWVYDIARKYEGVSPQDILNANNLTNPDVVVPGQELIIPVK